MTYSGACPLILPFIYPLSIYVILLVKKRFIPSWRYVLPLIFSLLLYEWLCFQTFIGWDNTFLFHLVFHWFVRAHNLIGFGCFKRIQGKVSLWNIEVHNHSSIMKYSMTENQGETVNIWMIEVFFHGKKYVFNTCARVGNYLFSDRLQVAHSVLPVM